MEEIWFDEELFHIKNDSQQELPLEISKQIPSDEAKLTPFTNGAIRVHRPRWDFISPKEINLLSSGNRSKFLIVKFGFEFEISSQTPTSSFTYARCEVYIRSAEQNNYQPSVYEVIPKDLYEGEPRKVLVKFGPQLTLGDYGGSLGEISSELTIGRVTPSIIGWKGKNEQNPYWELRPVKKNLLGIQNLWTIIEIPEQCKAIRVNARVEGEIQTLIGMIRFGPKERLWENRPSLKIEI